MRRSRFLGACLLLALAAGLTPARAEEPAAAGDACDRLVRLNVSRMERSPLMDFQLQVQAHGIAKIMVDALGRQLASAKWREGDPHWEEAYALLEPKLSSHMRSAGEQELRHQEASLPRHLDRATCEKHLALLESKLGATAQGIQDASDAKQFLDSFEKAFPTPPRLQALAAKVRRWISEGSALASAPEVRRQRARYEKAREELRAYGRRILEGLKKVGDGRGPEQQKASRDAGEQMIARHKERLADIIRRFREATGP